MTITEKLRNILDKIEIDMGVDGGKWDFYVGRNDFIDSEEDNIDINKFPAMFFVSSSYNQPDNNIGVYEGTIDTLLVISDYSSDTPIFEHLENEVLKSIFNTFLTMPEIHIDGSIIFDDDFDNIYSIIVPLKINFQYNIL